MILKIIEKFHRDNKENITEGRKPLDHKDFDKRLTMSGVTLSSEKVKKLTQICKNI